MISKNIKDQGIRHLTTLGHPAVAERQIRTLKDMIDKRTRGNDKDWWEVLFSALLTYNNKMVHNVTKMTPNDATEPSNTASAKINLEMNRRSGRKYPEIEVGDQVRVFRKRDKLDKERAPRWSENKYEVTEIVYSTGQSFYHITGREKPLMRSEILLV